MENYFTHLHVHTEYSLLDGAITHDALISFAKQHNLPAIGISDHGNIFGAVKFFEACKKAGIKPILGMEAYFTQDVTIKEQHNRYHHLLLIVQNHIGYKNLCKLIAYSYQQGFYFKPRIDYKILAKHAEGLIATTACIGGHIPTLLLHNQKEQAIEHIEWFAHHFGKDRFYFEVQPEEHPGGGIIPEQKIVNESLFALSKQYDINCMVGCDAHYASPDDHEAHEVMLAIQTHAKMVDSDRFSFGQFRAYLKTPDEIKRLFSNHLDAVTNTGKIADSCTFTFQTGSLFFPAFAIPKEYTPATFFTQLCHEGFNRLYRQDRIEKHCLDLYKERLDMEIELILRMGFAEYFLVVSDFIQWAYRNNIPVGPGRGSAAGSLVAWALQITNIDPIKYNLLFERFLNPERVTMPDIDIDFCIQGREKVIDYIKTTYGHDKVCQIITFGTMMAKGVLKDVARTLGIPFEDSNMITALIPDQLKITLKEAIEQEPRLKDLVDRNQHIQKLFDIAYRLEGITRHASKHAAGIVISPSPLDEVLPLYIPQKTDELVTQYDMTELEMLGFLKIDLLGLKNLTLIAHVIAIIQQRHGITIDIDKIPLDDAKTFSLLSTGNTTGVFQLESSGLKEVLRKLRPEKFEDIIAVNALYRPGPLGSGMVDDFIERKHGRQKIKYLFPELQPILEETYGVIVYQEQVMKIASLIAGYTLGQSDILRRAMGKKNANVMAQQRTLFIEGARAHNFDTIKAGELFDLMAYFAGYGFNKSHSAAYALIAYQTAYLKAQYPASFMASLISLETSSPETMISYIEEAKSMGISIKQPDINRSESAFSVDDDRTILFGLQGIKNIGLTTIEDIINIRNQKTFNDLFDFCMRVDLRTVNKRVIENLICAGALDQLPGNRAQKYQELPQIMELATARKKEILTGQTTLFSLLEAQKESNTHGIYQFQEASEWSNKDTLEREKEATGLYVSQHPLDLYTRHIRWLNSKPFTELQHNTTKEQSILSCSLLKKRRDITTKKGDRMTFVGMEDQCGNNAEIVIFPTLFKRVATWLDEHQIFVIQGSLDPLSERTIKIKADMITPLEILCSEWTMVQTLLLTIPEINNQEQIQAISQLIQPGHIQLIIRSTDNGKKLLIKPRQTIAVTTDMLIKLEQQQVSINLLLRNGCHTSKAE